ncbi:MAG: carbohydrate binding domain-containing protein [Kineosporiaceae bacterium]
MREAMKRRRRRLPAALAALALSCAGMTAGALVGASGAQAAGGTAGCGKAPTLSSGTRTIMNNGKQRSYILSVPDGYDSRKQYKLIFGMHWLNGSAVDVATGQTVQRDSWAYFGLKRLSNNTAIFVAPQGLNAGWANTGGEDVALVDAIIAEIENGLCVDTSQVFSTGWSYGGAFSFALACARPKVFRAVAVLSGGQLSGCAGGTDPVAYMGVHGVFDSVVNISMGRSIRDTFVRANGCTAASPTEVSRGSGRHSEFEYSGCKAGYPVKWYSFDGDHIPAPADGVGGISGNTWVPAETWEFFSQFASTSSPTPTTTSPTTSAPPQQGAVLTSTFDDGAQGWTGRGAAAVAVAAGGRTGSALSVTGRTDVWNGAIRDVTSILRPGSTYYVAAWVKLADGAPASSLNLSVERVSGGTTAYDHVGDAAAASTGSWTRLSGQYTVPADATSTQLYVEGDTTASFLLDDVLVSTDPIATTTPTTTRPTTSATTTKPTKSSKSTKVKTVKKCKTGKNGKKTCKTITRKAAGASTGASCVSVPAAWPGGYLAVVARSSVAGVPASAGVTQVSTAGGVSTVRGTGDPAALASAC